MMCGTAQRVVDSEGVRNENEERDVLESLMWRERMSVSRVQQAHA